MQLLVYILVYPLLWIVSIFPMRLLYVTSDLLYFLVYYIIGYRKKTVKENLALVFPEKPEKEIKSITKQFYHHLCDIIFETIKNLTISEAEIRKRFQVENMEVLESLYKQDRNVLLMCGHYASWEWSGIISKLMPHKGYAVYKPLKNSYLDKLVKKIRGRFGGTIISNKKIVSVLYRAIKKNHNILTLIISDQTPKIGAFKHRDTFMGIDVPVFTGSEELAKKLDFTSIYLKVEKVKRGYYVASFVPLAEDPIKPESFQITRLFLDEIEKQIRKNPAHYLWSHKRWKHRVIKD